MSASITSYCFSTSEYLLGDSAYTTNDFMVTAFKQPRAKSPHEQMFNANLSAQRVVIENTFGLLKARFPGITNVSIRIRNQVTHKRVVDYFEAACILHNVLVDEEGEERWEVPEDIEYARRHQMTVDQILPELEQQRRERRTKRKDDNLRESFFAHMISNII